MAKKKKEETNNPLQKAREALYTVAGTPPIDIDNIVSNLLKQADKDIAAPSDWKKIVNALDSGTDNAKINELIDYLTSTEILNPIFFTSRLSKYKEEISVLKKAPILKKIARLYTANILSPDDITKTTLHIRPDNAATDRTSKDYVSIESKFESILRRINLKKELYSMIFKFIVYGDVFIEINSSKRYLLQTLYNLQIPFNDKNINLQESRETDIINFFSSSSKEKKNQKKEPEYQVQIEWAKPIHEQVEDYIVLTESILEAVIDRLNKNNKSEQYRRNTLRYILDEMFSDTIQVEQADKMIALMEADVAEVDRLRLSIKQDPISNSIMASKSKINKVPTKSTPAGSSIVNGLSMDGLVDPNKKFSIDSLPVEATLSSINIKIHSPDKVIILRDEEIDYGYLYITQSLGSLVSGNNDNSTGSSTTAVYSSSPLTQFTGVANQDQYNLTTGAGSSVPVNSSVQNNNNNEIARQITTKIAQYVQDKFKEYSGNVNINNMNPNLQILIADILNKGSRGISVRYIPPMNMQQMTTKGTGSNEPYGESIVEDLLFRAKMMISDDIQSIINKFTNSGRRLIWKVRGNTHQQAANRIQQLRRQTQKKTVSIDNYVDLMSNILAPQDNIFIGKVGDQDEVEIDTLDLGSASDMRDPEMYNIKQTITGADIPPAHLGYEEWTSGKNTLSTENVVFAQSIVALQQDISSAITSLVHKTYLAIYSHTDEFESTYKNVVIALNAPRGISLSTYAEYLGNLGNITSSISELGLPKESIASMFWPELYDLTIKAKIALKDIANKGQKSEGSEDSGGYYDNSSGGGDEYGLESPSAPAEEENLAPPETPEL